MPIDLFGEPLKPFPIFFRTCTLPFVFNVAVQIAPSDAHCATQQLVDYVQRNHAREHRVAQRFENASYGLDGLKKNWEWFQWLAEQIDRHSKARTSLALGAHEAYGDWRP